MSKERTEVAWLRLFLEGVVVLVSILAAFFLEGWRSDRELARDLDQELVSVERELARNRDLVVVELAAINRVLVGTEALLVRLREQPGVATVAVPDSLAWVATLWGPTLDPSLGAVEALITSGRLSQVDDLELRLGLAGLRDLLVDAVQEENLALQTTFDYLFPLLLDFDDFAAIRRVSKDFTTVRQEPGLSPQEQMDARPIPTYQTVRYPNSRPVRTVLELKIAWYDAAVAELRPLLPHLEHLIDLVSAETG